jgi:hypothetical protein
MRNLQTGYTFDLALLRPVVPIILRLGNQTKFRPKTSPLSYNELLKTLSKKAAI